MSTKKGLQYHSEITLTKAEEEVLNLLTKGFLTPKQVQLHRNCSRQAVYKIIKKLKDKGFLKEGLQGGGSCQPKLIF